MIWAGLLAGALGCYATKLAGLSLPVRLLEQAQVRRVAATLPVALLGALAAAQTLTDGRHLVADARIVGVAGAVVAIRLRAPFLAVVAVAAALAALTRAVA